MPLRAGVAVVAVVLCSVVPSASAGGAGLTGDWPVWSPDGSSIAYVAPAVDWRFSRVVLGTATGAASKTITSADVGPDFGNLAFAGPARLVYAAGSDGMLYSVDIATRRVIPLGPSLTGGPVDPESLRAFSVSADGRAVAYTTTSPYRLRIPEWPNGRLPDVFAIGIVSSLGGPWHLLRQPVRASDADPAFAPDRRTIAFDRTVYTGKTRSTLRRSEPVLMTRSTHRGDVRSLHVAGTLPLWSPNGRWIAFQGVAQSGNAYPLRLVRPSGGRPHTLAPDASPFAWSPDSRRLAFTTHAGGIGVVDLSGRIELFSIGKLVVDSGEFPYTTAPQWSPDGKRLLFAAEVDGGNVARLYTIGANGRGLRRIG